MRETNKNIIEQKIFWQNTDILQLQTLLDSIKYAPLKCAMLFNMTYLKCRVHVP